MWRPTLSRTLIITQINWFHKPTDFRFQLSKIGCDRRYLAALSLSGDSLAVISYSRKARRENRSEILEFAGPRYPVKGL